jgi:hypothetical protein
MLKKWKLDCMKTLDKIRKKKRKLEKESEKLRKRKPEEAVDACFGQIGGSTTTTTRTKPVSMMEQSPLTVDTALASGSTVHTASIPNSLPPLGSSQMSTLVASVPTIVPGTHGNSDDSEDEEEAKQEDPVVARAEQTIRDQRKKRAKGNDSSSSSSCSSSDDSDDGSSSDDSKLVKKKSAKNTVGV